MKKIDLSLYLVTDRDLTQDRPIEEIVKEAVEGGVTIVQIREKKCTSLDFYECAMRVKSILAPYDIPLIINDRVDIALAVDADGLHIGQSDLPYAIARKLLGPNKIIGLSVENKEQAYAANSLDVDYIGLSPVFYTNTKSDIAPALGLDGIKEIAKISKHRMVGIGGINITNAKAIVDSGAEGVAVISAILCHKNPKQAAEELAECIRKN
ncbi:thiamine phosphate synthase [Ancylomarina sp. 16SWW S1-10-2]|uniref:thiamine phosphate synthase n=1 Tax=Ancylomarina sp. 16SWW S1-10-2 TaxID=2499681 RepID=UPI0012AD4F5C|nr:thiamine phosphate synthase [Ancylomarina sp. 16SWW S1-10-2]MRT92747.1 thiamine phosphate synthase [Ancylomarina sp. 16SWW S1-10-2]